MLMVLMALMSERALIVFEYERAMIWWDGLAAEWRRGEGRSPRGHRPRGPHPQGLEMGTDRLT